MTTIILQCNNLSQVHLSVFLQAENSMTGRAYMQEVLTKVWLKSIKKQVSYWTNKYALKMKENGVRSMIAKNLGSMIVGTIKIDQELRAKINIW